MVILRRKESNMGIMKYKGYTRSVDYSEEDNCLYGKVLGMSKDSITYEGQDVNELHKDFEGAIDDYLASCVAHGVKPEKLYSGNLNVRLTPEIHSRLSVLAQQAGTTINGYIRQTLAKATGVTL
jgi:predicted HicB family RNase H-like nuclease